MGHGRYLLFGWPAARAQSARALTHAVRRGGPATFNAASRAGLLMPSLRAWRLRLLSWYRRAARAEAREMVARGQRRMLPAEFERWRLHGVAWPLLALIDWWGSTVAWRRAASRSVCCAPR